MFEMKRTRSIFVSTMVACLLLLATLACGTPTTLPTAPSEIGAGSATPTAPPVATETLAAPAATATSAPDVTAASGCTLNAGWVADVTIPDNTELAAGTAFVKTWRVRNSGTCTWEAGTQLVYVSGDPLGGPGAVSVPSVAPGATTDVSVNFVAPATPGTYRSTWQMQSPEGTRFGSQIYVQIVVPAPATATPVPPTAVPTAEPTAAPTEGPLGPDLYISELTINPPNPQSGATIHVRVGTYNQGNQAAGAYKVTFRYGPQSWNLCTWDVPGNNPGGGRILECDALVYNEYTGVATTDVDGVIVETDETNNAANIAIPIPAATGVDLYISEMSITPANPHAGDTVTARIGVYNRGSAAAGAFRVYWRYWSGDFDVCDWGVSSLSARGGRILTCSVVLPGTFDTIATADAKSDILESVETNNERILHIEVSP